MITIALENANHTPNEWDNWLNTSPGQYVLNWEETQFGNAVEDAFGFDALQIGLPQLTCLAANRINHRWQMLLPSQTFINHHAIPQIHVICQASIYDLPFENESLDLIALPHVLEFMENPHEALREVHRILRPEGRIVISGFNPISLWGLRQYSGKLFNQPFLPTDGQFIGHRRIKDWLNLLNYSIDRGKFGCYGIPIKKSIMGGQQVIINACQCLIFKSSISVFLKIIPCVMKAVKVAKTPIKSEIKTTISGKKFLSPANDVSVVCFPVIMVLARAGVAVFV